MFQFLQNQLETLRQQQQLNSWIPTTRRHAVTIGLVGAGTVCLISVYRYRQSIRSRLKKLQEESLLFGGLRMKRVVTKKSKATNNWKLFELDDEFKQNNATWKFASLGEYLSTLRPAAVPEAIVESDMLPSWVRSELEAALSASLLSILGPSLGRAFLPALGFGPVGGLVQKLTSLIASKISGTDTPSAQDQVEDKAFLPVSLLGLLALSETGATKTIENRTTRRDDGVNETHLSSIDKMKLGEFGMKAPLVTPDSDQFPNPFVLSKHWSASIHKHEECMQRENTHKGQTTGQMEDDMRDPYESDEDEEPAVVRYNPFARNMAEPVPVNERLFPDLYMGWGDAKCTHTHREVLQNRLLCILLNRLASNYHQTYDSGHADGKPMFVVRLSDEGREITRPHELIQELMKNGNEVELVVTTHPTSFGAALCVKEEDGGWANIPLVTFVNSGYETADEEEAQALLPHSGLNLELRGSLIGDGERISIQHFIGIEGFCGWKSNHNADVPWLKDIECGSIVRGKDVVKGVRTAALYGLLLNIVGTEMELPFGGYGLVGVCNDSAAIMEYVLHGETHIYPLTAVGKYSVQVIRKAREFQGILEASGLSEEAKAIDDLVWAMKTLPSDIHACPSCMTGAGKRMLHCLPAELPFKLMKTSKHVSTQLVSESKLLLDPKSS